MKSFLITLLLVLLSAPAFAANENAAIVLKDLDHPFACAIDADGIPLYTEDEIHTVYTKSGNLKLICHFDWPEGFEPDKAVKVSGFGCGIYLPDESMETNNTRFVVNPGGRSKLVCTINPSSID